MSYKLATDTSDIKKAVANISDLASQTKRQADNSGAQLTALGKQLGEMQKQTTALQASADAQQGLRNDVQNGQQPIIAINQPISEPVFDTSGAPPGKGKNPWDVAFINSGKSTAEMSAVKVFMKVGEAKFQCVRDCKAHYLSPLKPGPPGATTTGWWPTLMTRPEFDALMKRDFGIYVLVAIPYRDQNGHASVARICSGHFANNSLQDCSGMFPAKDFQ